MPKDDFETTLRSLLEKATPRGWFYEKGSAPNNPKADHDADLILFLGNRAEAILRVVELLVKMRPHLHAQWKQEINAALAALNKEA